MIFKLVGLNSFGENVMVGKLVGSGDLVATDVSILDFVFTISNFNRMM